MDAVGHEQEPDVTTKPHPSTARRRAGLLALPACVALVAACGTGGAGADQTVEEFYAGNQVTLVVTQPPGGGFDTYARQYATCMPAHIPGSPTIVVENMPGAGNIVGMNYLDTAAARDGSVFGTGEGSVAIQQLLGAEGVLFDMADFQYIGMPDPPVNMVLVARREAGVASMDQLLDGSGTLKIGIPAPGSLLSDPAILLRDVIGANVQLVPGYEGTGPLGLATDQGEIDAFLVGDSSLLAEYSDKLSSGDWIALAQTAEAGESPKGAELIGDAPSFESLAGSEDDKLLIRVGVSDRTYHRPYFTPPEVPQDRFDALKSAWEACNDDPAFVADSEAGGRPIDPVSGEELDEIYAGFLRETPPAAAERLKQLLSADT